MNDPRRRCRCACAARELGVRVLSSGTGGTSDRPAGDVGRTTDIVNPPLRGLKDRDPTTRPMIRAKSIAGKSWLSRLGLQRWDRLGQIGDPLTCPGSGARIGLPVGPLTRKEIASQSDFNGRRADPTMRRAVAFRPEGRAQRLFPAGPRGTMINTAHGRPRKSRRRLLAARQSSTDSARKSCCTWTKRASESRACSG